MAAKPSESLKQIEKNILDQPQSYGFFQAFRLLENINKQYPVSPRKPARKIEVRPSLNLGYTDQDIHDIKPLDKQRGFEIVSQISGLYGVASPLPDFYNEELLDNEWDDVNAPREFLDIIHKQLFPKLYQAWRLYKLNLNTIERSNDSYWQLLYSLMGETQDSDNDIKRLKLHYFPLFSNKERSIHGLKLIVADYLETQDIEIDDFVVSHLPIKPSLMCKLGEQNHQLGEAHIGSKIFDQRSKISINVKGVPNEQLSTLEQSSKRISTLTTLVKHYLKKPLSVEIKLHVDGRSSQFKLGESWNQLGVTSTIGKSNTSHRPITFEILS
ncbi:type VI secretion system baseplate subunit TssG [Bermanella sp. R86510]|uniref:type VI secretion system baseplate subunit TssG n=1 Tax=unclassified Bermanella TaxID=2627862 RepID=UPI0037C64E22